MADQFKSLGGVLKFLREERKMTRQEIAAIAGISHNYICMLEGDSRILSSEKLERVASALRIPAAFITTLSTPTPTIGDNNFIFKDLLEATKISIIKFIREERAASLPSNPIV